MAILTANSLFVMPGLDINWFYQNQDSDSFRDNVGGDFEDEYDIVVRYLQPFRGKVEDVENATVFFEGKTIVGTKFRKKFS